jgi:nucleoside-diphosphate-sugar epimerase
MRLAIFGVGGFIGSNLAEHLLRATQHKVFGLDVTAEKLEPWVLSHRQFEFVSGDIRSDSPKVEELVESADVVIDLVAYANPSIYVQRPIEVVKLNLFENLKIVEHCMAHSKRLIQFSTCEVYGMTGGSSEPFNEERTCLIVGPIRKQRWIYSCAKQLLERMVYAYGKEAGLKYTIIRPFNFLGPKFDYLPDEPFGGPRVFAHFMAALLYGHSMYLVNGGNNQRSYTYIDDAVRAIALVLENPQGQFDNQIVNVGSPYGETSIRGLADIMCALFTKLTGRTHQGGVVEISGEEFYGEGYEDCDRRIPDVSKLFAAGWKPEYSLEETVCRTMEYFLSHASIAPEVVP